MVKQKETLLICRSSLSTSPVTETAVRSGAFLVIAVLVLRAVSRKESPFATVPCVYHPVPCYGSIISFL